MQIVTLLKSNRKNILLTALTVLVLVLTVRTYKYQAEAHGGNPNLIHSCLSPAGLIRILLDPNTSCLTGETPLDWDGRSTQRYQSIGGGFDPISPAATWLDVPNAAITRTFGEGEWKVTYSGMLKLSGGNGTAYVRLQIRPTGGSTSDIDTQTIYRFQSPLPPSEGSTMPFYLQRLITMPAGEVTIVPQIYGPAEWSLFGNSVLMLEF